MAEPTLTTEEIPPELSQKGLFKWDPQAKLWLDQALEFANKYPNFAPPVNTPYGKLTNAQIIQSANDPSFAEQIGLGQSYSYIDLAQEALINDPNYQPGDNETLIEFAKDIQQRGFDPNDTAQIQALSENRIQKSVQQSVQDQIDRALNPGKYLDESQIAANQETANRLLSQTFGEGNVDPDLASFLSEQLAKGESAFELSQFLQTTPQYLKIQSEVENKRVQEESAAAREALNQELLRSQQEAFSRAQPEIISSYMRAGRLNSSGLNSALAKAQKQLESERQGFLANVGYQDAARAQGYRREDFVGANNAAFQNYLRQSEPAYQQQFNLQNASNFANFQQPYNQLQRQYQLNDEARQRQYALQDYAMQQSDFNRYLSQYRSQGRENALYGLLGAGISGGLQSLGRR